jgi:hypothetical protein
MANWDFVVAYDARATDWLAEQGLPHPIARTGNRLPCTAEVISAWQMYDTAKLLLIDNFVWDDDTYVPPEYFKLRGDWLVELRVLVELSSKCGQLWMYPDTGAPAIVVDALLDIDHTLRLFEELYSAEDGWERFYHAIYGHVAS